MKKSVLFICIIIILSALLSSGIYALDDPQLLYTDYACVYNIENHSLIYSKNIDEKIPPAGTVKIMTAILAFEHFKENLDRGITVKAAALERVTGNKVSLKEGEVLTVRQLLGALIVSNANDAASVLAYEIGGSLEGFTDMMNAKANELELRGTNYTNPSGIHAESMHTTVRDVLTLTLYAYNIPEFIEISDMPRFTIEATNKSPVRNLYNRNYFISSYYNTKYINNAVMGISASSTTEAGDCLSAIAANDNGLTYIAIAMGSKSTDSTDKTMVPSYEDVKTMLNWAFKGYGYLTLLKTSTMICEIPVKLSSKTDHVILLPEEKITAFLPLDLDLDKDITKTQNLKSDVLYAPISEGQVVGDVTLSYKGKEIGKVNLIAKNNVDRSNWLYLKSKVVAFIKKPINIFLGIVILIALIAYIFIAAWYWGRKNKAVRYRNKKY